MKPTPIIFLALIGCTMGRSINYYTDRASLMDRFTGEQSAKFQQAPSEAPAAPAAEAKASVSSRVQCGKNTQKRLADPNNPGKFYMCNFSGAHQIWIMYSFDCPKGTRFDQDGQKCVSGASSRPQMNHGFSNQNTNFQKILSDRVMAKINAMLKANVTRGHGDSGMSQQQPQQTITPQPLPVTASPMSIPAHAPNLNVMWANHVKNYIEWKNKGGFTTTAKYPKFSAPVMPSFVTPGATPTTTTTTATTTTPAPPIPPMKMPLAKNFKTMRRIRLYASKINTLAEEINHLVMCMESTENCDDGQSSTEYSSESAGHSSIVKKDRPDFSEEYHDSQEESSSNEEEIVAMGNQQPITTSTMSPQQPLVLSTLASVPPETKEWNVFLQNPGMYSTESPAALKPPMSVDASSPKSSHEDDHIDFAQVIEDILRNPPQPFDADHESVHSAGAAIPVKVHGHTLFDDDTPGQQEHHSHQQHPVIEEEDTKENANGSNHRKPRQAE